MRKIKHVLRLHLLGGVTSRRRTARAVGCSKSAVAECLRRAAIAGVSSWGSVAQADEAELEQRLYPTSAKPRARTARPLPDWSRVREELGRRDHHVTLALLWSEYKAEHPDGYQYSQFAERYRCFEKKLSVVLRQHHQPGEKSFVDFCDGLALTDLVSGKAIPTQLFVGALGASSYTFATATLSQALPEWLDCHVRMYEFFEGVSALTIPDNLRAGVTRPDRYEGSSIPRTASSPSITAHA
jgi:transposase